MKLLHIITSARAEGTPMLVLDMLSCGKVEQGVALLKDEGRLKTQFEKNKNFLGQLTGQPMGGKGLLRFFKLISATRKLVKKQKPEAVCCWNTGASPYVILGARLAGVKKLLVHAGNPAGKTFFGGVLMSWLAYWTALLCGAKVICCSDYIQSTYTNVPLVPSRIFYSVYNAVNLNKFINEPWENKKLQAVMVATLEKHKDHLSLLKAWKQINSTIPQAKLYLAGDGSLKNELLTFAKQLELFNVEFLGSVDFVPQLLKESKCFVLSTTEREGFGTVLIEAMASNCAIVATNVSACAEVLQNGKYGDLFEPNDIEGLTNRMESILRQDGEPLKNEAAFSYASSFSIENMLRQYLKVLDVA